MTEEKDGASAEAKNGTSGEWISAVAASALSGIRLRELERAANRGQLRRKRENGARDGLWLYFAADAAAYANTPKNAKPSANESPEVQLARSQADLFAKTALHLERSWALIHGPVLDVVTDLRVALREANEANRLLRAEMLKGDEQRRKLEEDSFTRQLARETLERDQKRKDEAFEGAKKAASAVWPSVEEALKGFSVVGRLRGTFDPAKIQALLEVPGMLDEREAALLRDLFGIPKPGEAAPEAEATEPVEATGEAVEP